MEGFNLLLIVISLLLGIVLGNEIYFKKPTIFYVSQEEILELEKERMKAIENLKDREMFFGNSKIVAELIEDMAYKKNTKNQRRR